jgi:hypothetical protein
VHNFALEDAVEFHAFAPLEASMRVNNGIPREFSLSYRLAMYIASKH